MIFSENRFLLFRIMLDDPHTAYEWTSASVPAAHEAPEFCKRHRCERRVFGAPASAGDGKPQHERDGTKEKENRKRNAGRRTHFMAAPNGARRDPFRGRSPVGVPPRHLRQRPNAAAQLQ